MFLMRHCQMLGFCGLSEPPLEQNINILPTAVDHLRTIFSQLVSWCFKPSQPQKDYIRAEHKLYYNSKLNIISQVIILPQFMIFEPIYMPRALNTGTSIQQGDLFYSAGQHRKKLGEVLKKMQVNGLEGQKPQDKQRQKQRQRQRDRDKNRDRPSV